MQLADDLLCIALDEHNGSLRVSPAVAGLGVAAALITETLLTGHTILEEGRFRALYVTEPEDELARSVHQTILQHPQHTDVGTWLAYYARDAVDLVAKRLQGQGVVTIQERRSLLPGRRRTLYVARDATAVAWPGIRMANALSRPDGSISPGDLVCMGLCEATGLRDVVLWDSSETHRAARAALPSQLATLPEPVQYLMNRTEVAIADAVLTNSS